MKLEIINDDEIILYLKKSKNYNINYRSEKELEKVLKDIFVKLKDIYKIKINGYYNIYVFVDDNYGVVLKIEKESLEYYDFMDNQVDMKIIIKTCKFVYKIDDYFDTDNKLYKYNNEIYLLPVNKLSNIEMGYLMEKYDLIWDSEEIINNGIIIN